MILCLNEKIRFFFFDGIGSGFRSLKSYGSGFFRMRMKLPNKDSTGIFTTFYVSIFLDPLPIICQIWFTFKGYMILNTSVVYMAAKIIYKQP